ncbi:helix-turn-helix domain-containing protein [Nocardia sp. NPDC050799]|uniref:PucR family transcriptional regulator n=1 Tax=Nocardia sp. NPDC050799 TaxID=3154842 RepID=UPI0033E6C548
MIDNIALRAPETRHRTPVPDIPRFAREIVAHLVRTGVPCAVAPEDTLGSELTAVARSCLVWIIRRLNGEAVPDQIERLESAAARWAHYGVPIGTVLHAVHQGLKKGVDLLFPVAHPGHGFDITTGMTAVVQLLNSVTSSISKIYVRELKSLTAAHRTAVHTLTSALLSGHTTAAAARECGISVASHYLVLAVAIPAHPDERKPGLDRHIVARRKLRRVQSALATRSDSKALSLLSVDGGTILLPAEPDAEPAIDELVQYLSAAAQIPLTATALFAATEEIAAATRHAHELLDTVEHLGLGPGVHRFTELAMEYQLTRPGIGRTVLQQRLAPLDDHPDLGHTLQTYIANDRNRQRTARQLCLHPNTIDYRLQRIGELTGLDIADAKAWWYLHAALITRTASPHREPANRNDPRQRTSADRKPISVGPAGSAAAKSRCDGHTDS